MRNKYILLVLLTLTIANTCVFAQKTTVQPNLLPGGGNISAPFGEDGSRCGPGTVVISATSGTGGNTVRWYDSQTGGNLLQTAVTFVTPGIGSSRTYYITSYNTSTGAESTPRMPIQAFIYAVPANPSTSNNGRCGSGSVILNATPGGGGNVVEWYDAASGGTKLSSSNTYTTPVLSTSTTYYINTFNTTTTYCKSDRIPVTAIIKAVPSPPSVAARPSPCGSGSVTLSATLGAGADQILWTDASGNVIGTGNVYVTAVLTQNTVFYAKNANTSTGCISSSVTADVELTPLPSAPTTTSAIRCGSGTVTLGANHTNTAYQLRWYTTASGGSSIYTGNSYSPNVSASSTIWYVSAFNPATGCESASRTAVTASVKSIPPVPDINGQQTFVCGDQGSVTLQAWEDVAGGIRWYNSPTDPTVQGTSNNFITPVISGTTNFYVTAYNPTTTCESPRVTVTATITPLPAPPSFSTIATCEGSSITITPTMGANAASVKWYDNLGNLLYTGTSFTTPVLSGPVYYKAESIAGSGTCVSAQVQVPVNVNPTPKPPSNGSTVFIFGSGSVNLIAAVPPSQDVYWYNDANATNQVGTGITFTTPILYDYTAYYAKAKDPITQCTSKAALFNAEVEPLVSPAFVKTELIRVAGKKEIADVEAASENEKRTVINYMDGLSRVTQQVSVKGSPLGKDVVSPVEYDAMGRVSKSYLPYVAQTTDGSFRSTYVGEQATFYDNTSDKVADDTAPYAVTNYENSPIGRPIEQGGTGLAWQPGNGHSVKTTYSFNTGDTASEAEEVRKFNSDGTSTSFYGADMLNRIEVTNEDGNKEIIFQDQNGRTLARKQQLDQVIEGATVNYLQTYYLYNDLGQLINIITPRGVVTLRAAAWAITTAIKDSYLHQMLYDARGRLVEKKTPGQARHYYVYDKLNRIVLTQDGKQKTTNQWLFTKYDIQGRAVMQGLYTNATQVTRATVQSLVDALYTSTNTTYPTNNYFEKRAAVLHGYSNNSFPIANADNSSIQVLGVSYFDNYDFDYDGNPDQSYEAQNLPGEATPTTALIGLATGSKRLVLGTNIWLYNYVFYDQYGKAIQSRSNNHMNPSEMNNFSTVVYDFEGKVLATNVKHNAGAGKSTSTIQRHEYDAGGRIKNIYRPVAKGSDVVWTDGVGVTIEGNSVIKSNGSDYWGDGGMFSSNTIPDNADGWVEFKTSEVNSYKMLGLSYQNTNASWEYISYALYLTYEGTIEIYESGSQVAANVATYTANDIFSVERKGGIIYYKKNNAVIYTSQTSSSGTLHADATLYSAGATLKDVKLYQATEKIVAQYEYNELGQVVDKKLHNTEGTSFLQSVDYRYSIRGQLLSINNAQLTSDGVSNDEVNDYFGMELAYNADAGMGNTALYNGNISAVKWKGAGGVSGANDQKSYKFAYDKSNKLLTAISQLYAGTAWTKEAGAMNENITYDHNGNVKTLQRTQRKHQLAGLNASYISETIDNLTYTYKTGLLDQLSRVTDAATAAGFNNGTSTTATDYTYDTEGNVLSDKNKGISAINYNILGKADKITFTDGRVIDYLYDASGSKLTMTVTSNGITTTTEYVDGFVYENGNLTTYGAPEGRIVMNGTNPEYQYAIADHQGNTRIVFSSVVPEANTKTANMEDVSNSDFQNYSNAVSFDLMDHTDEGSLYTYSQKLSGAKAGLAKSIKVYPGDKVKLEAYAKYFNPQSSSANLTAFAGTLLTAFGLPTPAMGEVGTAAAGVKNWGSIVAAGGGNGNTNYPKAFVNILVFDKNYNFLDISFQQIDGGEQTIGSSTKTAHDYMSTEYTAREEGYVFMYVSNETSTQVEVYFDDVVATHTPTNIVQYNEYYPFGLQANTSWTRENNKNNFLYNEGGELNTTTGLYDLAYRNYDPTVGRFFQVDPLAHLDHSVSSFAYGGNNPVLFNDPNGDKVNYENGELVGSQEWANAQYAQAAAFNYAMAASWAQDARGGYGYGGGSGINLSGSSQAALAVLIGKAEGGDVAAAGIISSLYGDRYSVVPFSNVDYSSARAADANNAAVLPTYEFGFKVQYEEVQDYVYWKSNPTLTMDKQIANTCVTSIMTYVNHEYGGNLDEGKFHTYYAQAFGKLVAIDGVAAKNIKSFTKHFFKTTSFTTYRAAIDAGNPVMTSIFMGSTQSEMTLHNVLIIGYDPNDYITLIYINPLTGGIATGSVHNFGGNYNIQITGNKE